MECEACISLGSFEYTGERNFDEDPVVRRYDLYWCPTGGIGHGTIITKDGDEPHEYGAGLEFVMCRLHYFECWMRACERGLPTEKDREYVRQVALRFIADHWQTQAALDRLCKHRGSGG